ncbi:DUF4625 domain-containing protein [Pedobacter polaris]|uniref:DUF4625 domain-containing protein n=1 Tax=Pedobacter polaris TaxID=2571273 RepID=A0A4U1CUB8_9SPHI|nr:DUF4625 domain-containing protein [Pedobacter polaris]TKC10710.1 DUF4625 domain-containing protein [Pedobacter polaris]
MKKNNLSFLLLLLIALFAACKKDKETIEPEHRLPSIENLEIGLANGGFAVIGNDFHFNADILAGEKLAIIELKIVQKVGESYTKPWKYEITYEQYKGVKNVTLHKHFDIPTDAPEGKYDFFVIVHDQNGRKLEIKKDFIIYSVASLPVNPILSILNISESGKVYYRNGKFENPSATLKKGQILQSQVTIGGVKGDGKMYLLLIKKNANHRPESIDQIDFNKVIVYDVYEHNAWKEVGFFSNVVFDMSTFTTTRNFPDLTVGATTDHNLPQGNPITGSKAWSSGDYYYAVLYKNTTHNMSFSKYIEFAIDYN